MYGARTFTLVLAGAIFGVVAIGAADQDTAKRGPGKKATEEAAEKRKAAQQKQP